MEGRPTAEAAVAPIGVAIIDERGLPNHKEAAKSVERLKPWFSEVHVLRAEDFDMSVVSATGQALVYLPSNLELTGATGGLAQLREDMVAKSPKRNRFALASVLRYEGSFRSMMAGLVWLGFLPVLAVLDWWRGLANLWGYQCAGDLRVETLVTTYPSRKHVESESIWCCCCSRIAQRRRGPTLIQHLSGGEEFAHLVHTVRTHPHLGWFINSSWPIANCVWLPAFTAYYYCFALPWWNWIVDRIISGYVPAAFASRDMLRVPFALLYEYPLSRPWWWIVLAVHLLVVVLPVTMQRVQLGAWWRTLLVVALYPVFLTLSPLTWFLIKVSA